MNAELFPKEAEGLFSSMVTSFNWAFAFVVIKCSVFVEDAIHTSGLYFVFGGTCALGIIFVVFLMPETKGKTPEDMRKYFQATTKKKYLFSLSFIKNLFKRGFKRV